MTQTSLNRWLAEQILVHLHNGIVLNNEKEWNTEMFIYFRHLHILLSPLSPVPGLETKIMMPFLSFSSLYLVNQTEGMNAYGVRSKSASYINYFDVTCGLLGAARGFPAGLTVWWELQAEPTVSVHISFLLCSPWDSLYQWVSESASWHLTHQMNHRPHGGTLRGGGEQATIYKRLFSSCQVCKERGGQFAQPILEKLDWSN